MPQIVERVQETHVFVAGDVDEPSGFSTNTNETEQS